MGVVGKNTNRPNIQQQSYHREFLARLCNGPWKGSHLFSSSIPHRKGQAQDDARARSATIFSQRLTGSQARSYKEKIALARITRTGNCSRLLQIVAFLLQKKEIIFTSCA
jgi:hypothetical protein